MSAITTHVLDIAGGRPAAGITIRLERPTGDGAWTECARGVTDTDGRVSDLLPAGQPASPGTYRLVFETSSYFPDGFYPEVPVVFEIRNPGDHHHVPLLLSPHGYSTYRGS